MWDPKRLYQDRSPSRVVREDPRDATTRPLCETPTPTADQLRWAAREGAHAARQAIRSLVRDRNRKRQQRRGYQRREAREVVVSIHAERPLFPVKPEHGRNPPPRI